MCRRGAREGSCVSHTKPHTRSFPLPLPGRQRRHGGCGRDCFFWWGGVGGRQRVGTLRHAAPLPRATSIPRPHSALQEAWLLVPHNRGVAGGRAGAGAGARKRTHTGARHRRSQNKTTHPRCARRRSRCRWRPVCSDMCLCQSERRGSVVKEGEASTPQPAAAPCAMHHRARRASRVSPPREPHPHSPPPRAPLGRRVPRRAAWGEGEGEGAGQRKRKKSCALLSLDALLLSPPFVLLSSSLVSRGLYPHRVLASQNSTRAGVSKHTAHTKSGRPLSPRSHACAIVFFSPPKHSRTPCHTPPR